MNALSNARKNRNAKQAADAKIGGGGGRYVSLKNKLAKKRAAGRRK